MNDSPKRKTHTTASGSMARRIAHHRTAGHGRLVFILGGCGAAAGLLSWALLSGAIGAGANAVTPMQPTPTASTPLPAAQAAAASGHPLAQLPPGPPNPATSTTPTPWFQYVTQVIPDVSISFANVNDGWMVSGLGTNQHLDDDLTAGSSEQMWPGPGVATTTDGGTSWTTTLTSASGIWGIDSLSASQLWAVGVTALYGSQNGGASWTTLGEPSGTVLVNVRFTSSADGVGITTHGTLVATTNGGETWTAEVVSGLTDLADACVQDASVLIDNQAGDVWESSDPASASSWSEVYTPPAIPTGTESLLSCGFAGGAWEETYPNQQGSGVTMSVAETSSAANARWSQSASGIPGQSSKAVVAGTNAAASVTDWIPITGAGNPLMIGNPGDPSAPAGAIYRSVNGSKFSPVSIPDLFDGTIPASADGSAGPPNSTTSGQNDLVVAHGIAFDSLTDGWLYADILTGVGTPNLSDHTVVYHTTNGGSDWSATYQSVEQGVPPSN